MPETDFLVFYDVDSRVRHYHLTVRGKVIEFVLQLEVLMEGKWYPVIRYDTSHGYAHRDVIHPNGSVSKTPLFVYDYNEALSFAEGDIKSNWELYKERFLREAKRDEEGTI